MDFDAALLAHSAWKRKLKAYLENPDGSLKPEEVVLDNQCQLGEWIAGEGHKYACAPVFRTLTAEHARFHKAAAELVRKANVGENVNAEMALVAGSEFSKAAAGVVNAIVEIKKTAQKWCDHSHANSTSCIKLVPISAPRSPRDL